MRHNAPLQQVSNGKYLLQVLGIAITEDHNNAWSKKILMRLNEGAIVAGTTCWQLESLDGKGEILVVGVVHQEPVVERFLQERKKHQ